MEASILLVDDDPSFRALATRMLAAMGMAVLAEAGTVAEALEAAERLQPSAILLDVELPDGNGVELAHTLTALPWAPHVVLTSADAQITSPDEVRSSGARAFVPKIELPGAPLKQLLGQA
jgi:CheY-like chemotaxis protein